MKYYKKLAGDRIYLSPRNNQKEDIEKFTEWLNDFQVTDYIGHSQSLITYNSEVHYFDDSTVKSEDINFNIVTLDKDSLIGTISLRHFNWVSRTASLGIFIGDVNFRNNGYGTEAIQLILEFAFRYLNLHSVTLGLVSTNERAHQCYLKCGFKDAGVMRDQMFINGKYYNRLNMDILESEFTGSYIKNKNL